MTAFVQQQTTNKNKSCFDYVIVGAGPSAMGLLYSLLEPYKHESSSSSSSSSSSLTSSCISIAVIERGFGPPHDATTVKLSSWYDAANNNQAASFHPTSIAGRRSNLPIGKGLGGTSNINAGLCIPPLQQDLESWPEPWKTSLWPCIQFIQRTLKQNNALTYSHENINHNNNSNNNNTIDLSDTPSPFNPKAPIDLTTNVPIMATKNENGRYVRVNYHDGLITPLLEEFPHLEKHITWIQGVEVQQLLMTNNDENNNNKRNIISGVECYDINTQRLWDISANRAVFLCAGAIETPAILLASGITNIHGIGKHLKDHVLLPHAYLTPWRKNDKQSLNGVAALGHMFIDTKKDSSMIFQIMVTDAAANPSVISYIPENTFRRPTTSSDDYNLWSFIIPNYFVDMFFFVLNRIIKLAIVYTPFGYFSQHFTAVTNLCLMHPKSEGQVTIKPNEKFQKHQNENHDSNNNNDDNRTMGRRNVQVEVEVGYWENSQDFDSMQKASTMLGGMVQRQQCFEILPGSFFRSLQKFFVEANDWFRIYCKLVSLPYYHYCSTCRMKVDNDGNNEGSTKTTVMDDWVVDENMKLRGMQKVYICDASVFPSTISSPPALTCAALGYGLGKSFCEQSETKQNSK